MEPQLVILLFVLFIVLVFVAMKAVARSPDDSAPPEGAGLGLIPHRFVVFDLETTGLDPRRHEIIEIGAIKAARDSDTHETFEALVRPTRRIPKKITQMTGISQQMVNQDGKPPEAALQNFADFIADLPLVSFNAEFDMAFLRSSGKRYNVVIRNRASCALKMARRAWPGRASYRLCDLARDGNLSDEDTHRALGDCKRTLVIYIAAASRVGVGHGKEDAQESEVRQGKANAH